MLAALDTKTVYSFMDSVIDLDSYIQEGKRLGYESLAIMDKNNLYAAYHFLEKMKAAGMQPIIGMELEAELDGHILPLRLIALSTKGYQQLMKISTIKLLGHNAWSDFIQYMEDLALVVPYFEGAEKLDLGLDYYLGIQTHTPRLADESKCLPLETVRYFKEEEREVLQVLTAIRDNQTLSQVGQPVSGQALPSAAAYKELYQANHPQAWANLEILVAGIDYEIDPSLKLPRFNPERPAVEELREKTETALREKGLDQPIYSQRLEMELDVIHKMGFDDYFLIVWDLIRFGRSQNYYMGMGRGSAVGSLVAYLLDITGIDPVKNHLLFERFLNLERFTMPDIDIDIPDLHRVDFLHYVRDRYGSMHAAQIVTFSTFAAKQAVRDVFKRFGANEYDLGQLTKKIAFGQDLDQTYQKNISFRQLIESKPEYQKAFQLAKRIQGFPRQTSIHAAGVVMADQDLTNFTPLKFGQDMLITQYDAHSVEANGLLKMDLLGLRNLTYIQTMRNILLETQGIDLKLEDIPLEDKETLALFAAGRTKGIFQFEQAGAIQLLRRIQPSNFEEVVATTSLNRPGASDYIDNFVKRKAGKEAVEVLDPSLEAVLAPTFGIMLYQEQVMQVAQIFGGFSLGKADILRRAMGKKDAGQMKAMQAEFLAGAAAKGHPETKARQVFAIMEKFAGYGFNRSHAYAYSALAFQMAYFKAHYPDIFFQVMFNQASSDYIEDALTFGYKLAKPKINTVPYYDKFDQGLIHLGLKKVKGLQKDLSMWILENRPFASIEDFLTRLPLNYRKGDQVKILIRLGLFDQMESNRLKIEKNLDHLYLFVDEIGSLFAEASYSWINSDDYSNVEKYQMEQDLIGVGLSPHPLVEASKNSYLAIEEVQNLVAGQKARILVQIEDLRVIRTKKGEQMAFIKVTDTKNHLDVTLFPETYQAYRSLLEQGRLIYLKGKMQERDGRLQMILEQAQPYTEGRFWILVDGHEGERDLLKVLRRYPGAYPVIVHYQEDKKTLQLEGIFVAESRQLEEELSKITVKTVYR